MTGVRPIDLPLLTADEVSELIRLPAQTVRELARQDRLPSVKLGRRRLYSRAAIEQAIARAAATGRPL